MKHIAYITNSSVNSGVGHRAQEIRKILATTKEVSLHSLELSTDTLFLDKTEISKVTPWPGTLGAKSINWIRLQSAAKKEAGKYDIIHATNQTLSFLLDTNTPSVVTVHDIIELREPQNKLAYAVNRFLYKGIRKADRIIAVSEFTKQQLIEEYNLEAERITVIHNGVDMNVFKPLPQFKEHPHYQTLEKELDLAGHHPLIIYVGSDHKRKNLTTAIKAFHGLLQEYPSALFLKVGAPGINAGRTALLDEITTLGIENSIRFIDSVSEETLNELYTISTALLFPSSYEGFGLPLLQAMAVGLPVITSNASSIPEVVGDATLIHDPEDVEAFTNSLLTVAKDSATRTQLIQKGLEQARKFTWDIAAEKELAVYASLE